MCLWCVLTISASCADRQLAIAVDVTAGALQYYVSDSACSCKMYYSWPDAGACIVMTDAGRGCACHPGSCLTSVSLQQGANVIASVMLDPSGPNESGGFQADMTQGLELVFEGCGDTARAAIPTVFPTAPSITGTSPGMTGTHVEWVADPSDAYLLWATQGSGVLEKGAFCRTLVGASAFDLPVQADSPIELDALAPPVTEHSGSTRFDFWPSSGDHPGL